MSNVSDAASDILENIQGVFKNNGRTLELQQVLCLAEEVGEFVGAYRRWAGLARRNGPWEDVQSELADVVIAAYVASKALKIDLDTAIDRKLDVIFTRGWKDAA